MAAHPAGVRVYGEPCPLDLLVSLYLSISHSFIPYLSLAAPWKAEKKRGRKKKTSQKSALIFSSIKTQYTHTWAQMLIYTGPPLTAPFSCQETFDPVFLLNSRVPWLIGYQFCRDSGQLRHRLSASLLYPFEAIVPLCPLLVPTSDGEAVVSSASLIFCRPSQRSILQIRNSQCPAMMENCWYAFNLQWLKADQTTPVQGTCSCLIPQKWNCRGLALISLCLRDC